MAKTNKSAISPEVEQAISSEEKILIAARKVFSSKGFAGAKTRDIAQEAGINLALLNYYFRSKEKLFEVVMLEAMQSFIKGLGSIVNDETLSYPEKVKAIVANYTKVFLANPDLPLFVMTAIRNDATAFESKIGVKNVLMKSHLMKQLKAALPPKVNPFHFVMNVMALTVFPFLAAPMLKVVGSLEQEAYEKLIKERMALIPIWIEGALLHTNKIRS